MLEPAAVRQLVFDMVHGLMRNRVRLHHQRRAEDPWCRLCLSPRGGGQRLEQDLVHIFTKCCLVRQAWQYTRALVRQQQPGGGLLGEEELVSFTFINKGQDKEVVWILANFFHLVLTECEVKGKELKVAGVRGQLQAKLRSARYRNVGQLNVKI